MFGGVGEDVFHASTGDYIDGGQDTDTVTFESASNGAIVNLANPFLNGGSAADSFLFSIELLEGSAFADEFSAGSDPVTMYGGAGDDLLFGGASNDRIEGQEGSDLIEGGGGGDLLIGDSAEFSEFANLNSEIA
jgi:Ca2+-binding RTX toxin-like protein